MSQKIAFADGGFIPKATSDSEETTFDSLVILEFSLKVPPPAIQWLVDKIKLLKSKGGSELQVCPIVDENHEVVFSLVNSLLLCTAQLSFDHRRHSVKLYGGEGD